MKKFAILVLVISGFTFGSMRLVNGQQASLESPQVTPEFKMSGITNVIDGIEIPQEVLEYVQLTYDGHAVTKAEKTVRDGQEVYRLRVDRDDVINDHSSFSLLFSKDWKLLGRERAEVPKPQPQPAQVERQPKPEPEEKEKPEQKPESNDKPEGGRGGGSEPAEQQEENEESESETDEEEAGSESDTDTSAQASETTSN